MHRVSLTVGALSAMLATTASALAGWPLGGAPYQRGFPHEPPPSYFGFPLEETNPSFYGGGRYREYYSYGRGYGLANFPGPLPSYPYGRPSWNYWTFPKNPPTPSPVFIPQPSRDQTALLTVHVPPDAEVWLEGLRMKQTGARRRFLSPPLSPDDRYAYDVRARWQEDGRDVEQVQKIVLHAGDRIQVRFPIAESDTLPEPRRLPPELNPE